MGASRPPCRRRDGRLQPRGARRGAQRRTGRPRGLRRVRPGRRGGGRAPARGPPPPTGRALRGVAGGRRRVHRPGLGAYGRGRAPVLRRSPLRRGRFRRPGGACAAAAGTETAVLHGLRDRGPGVGRGRRGARRLRHAPRTRRHRGDGSAVAGRRRHGGRLRVLVHRHAAHRCRARHPVLRAHPRGGGMHRATRRHRDVRRRAGRRQRARRRRSGARLRGVRFRGAPGAVSGWCRG